MSPIVTPGEAIPFITKSDKPNGGEFVAPLVPRDPVAIKRKFLEAIGTPRYVSILFGGGMLDNP